MQPGGLQARRQGVGCLLAGMVVIVIEGNVNLAAVLVTKLRQLQGCQMSAQRAGGVAKASLPERGQIEQAFDQNHSRERADGVPGKQTTLRIGAESDAGTPRR